MGKKGKKSKKNKDTMSATINSDSSRNPVTKAKKLSTKTPDAKRYLSSIAVLDTALEQARIFKTLEQATKTSILCIRAFALTSIRPVVLSELIILFDESLQHDEGYRFLRAEGTRDSTPYNTNMQKRTASQPVLASMNGSLASFTQLLRLVAASQIFLSSFGPEYISCFLEECLKQFTLWEHEWRLLLKTKIKNDDDDNSLLGLPEHFSIDEVGYVLGTCGAFAYRAIFYQSQRPGGLKGCENGGATALLQSSTKRHWRMSRDFAELAVRCGDAIERLSLPLVASAGHIDLIWCYTSGCGGSKDGRSNFLKSAHHAEHAIAQADLKQDDYTGAIARWELGCAVMFGCRGPKFTRGVVKTLCKEAEACESRLKKWGQHKKVSESCVGNTMVQQFIKLDSKGVKNSVLFDAHEHPNQNNSSRTNSGAKKSKKKTSHSGNGVEVEGVKIGSVARPHNCDGCGLHFAKVKKCGRCKVVSYHNGSCQKQHWKEHKKVCFNADA